MGKKVSFEVKESLSDLQSMRRSQSGLRSQQRLDALICLKSKRFDTRMELASHLSVHIRTLERWLSRYESRGLEGMVKDLPRRQGSRLISEEVHRGLRSRVEDAKNPFRGYWEARQWVLETYGVEVSYQWLREYLISHFGTKVKRPRKGHVKKEEGAAEAFLKNAPTCWSGGSKVQGKGV